MPLFTDTVHDVTASYHMSKLSCWRPFYYLHVSFAYLVTMVGVACILTRLHSRLYGAHLWLGRTYIILMLWYPQHSR